MSPTLRVLASAAALSTLMSGVIVADDAADQAAHAEFFEAQIRPLLVKHCVECHGPEKQEAALRLDLRALALKGTDTGPVIVPRDPEGSRLIQVVRYPEDDTQMPPDGKLADEEIALLTRWIAAGAAWPADRDNAHEGGIPRLADGAIDFERAVESHWAYRLIERPVVPSVSDSHQPRTPIDAFIGAQLDSAGLTMSPEADRRTLIRRATIDLTGLPPTYDEVEAFVHDPAVDAYEQLVDRLLASPAYGQRWARHWLDVARYADTKGYVFTENRFYPHAYTYRDYVVSSFNDDKSYDRFVVEQLAADKLNLPGDDPALAALGFLTVGPRLRNNQEDIIDDRIDVVSRGLMGLTLGCCRCHDHKFDPVTMRDYYALYGVFASSTEPESLPVVGTIVETPEYLAYKRELEDRAQAVKDYEQNAFAELLDKARSHADDYLLAAAQGMKLVDDNVEFEHGAPRAKLAGLWRTLLARRVMADDAVFAPLHAVTQNDGEFAALLDACLTGNESLNPQVGEAIKAAQPQTLVALIRAYGKLFSEINDEWRQAVATNGNLEALPDADREQLRRVLYGSGSVTDVAFEQATRLVFERDNRDEARKLERRVSEWETESPGAPPRAMILADRDAPVQPVVFLRGNPQRRGDPVPRRFPEILGGDDDAEFANGSGRLDLARSIASERNPLTARVFVNRVWQHHFGAGLVNSPSDFGTRIEPPRHVALLDYLAAEFMRHDWSTKWLHREIMLSAVYRQQSRQRGDALAVDAENSLLWRMNTRRLEFEAMRDSLLSVAGKLDPTLGGRPVDIEQTPLAGRRTIYALVDRNNLPGLFRTFDYPSPDISAPARPSTTVPQQALFGMNADFVQELSRMIATQVTSQSADHDQAITALFRRILSRDPQPDEREMLRGYLDSDGAALKTAAQALLLTNEFYFVD